MARPDRVHRQTSAQYVSKREDVLDIYQRPYDPEYPVVFFDETRKEFHAGTLVHIPCYRLILLSSK